MRNLPSPVRDAVRNHLITALALFVHRGEQHGYSVTEAELDEIISLYDHYDNTMGVPSQQLKGDGLSEDLKNEAHDAYRFLRERGKLSDVRVSLTHGIEKCPICGISFPGELDHHLPRSSFKALAIYVRNLIPHCHDCNHRKSAFTGNGPAQRFVHAYLDVLPNVQFLNATISLTGGGLDVEIASAHLRNYRSCCNKG